MNTKSNFLKSIFISLILLVGATNAWADITFSGGYIYFDNSIGINQTYIQLCARQSSWTGVSTLSKINNTKLYYVANPQGSGWGGILGWVVIGNSTAKTNSNFDNWTNYGWCSNWNTYGFNSGSTYLIVPTSTSKSQSVNTSYYSGGYSALNSQQAIKTVVDGSDANSKATISLTSYKMTGNGAVTKQEATHGTGSKDSYITAARTATTTLTVGDVATGYQFDGWYTAATGGTQLSTSTTYTYYPTAATTVYARFSAKKYNITYKDQGGSAFSGTHATGYPTTHTYGTATTLKDPTKDGYTFDGWYKESACTNKVTTLGATAYTADITLYAKWEQNTQPSITISTTQQYLQIGADKLTLTINYTNIPEGHCYRVKVGDGYYNGNANGENNDRVSISGSGSVAFTTYSTLPGGTQSIVVELWKSNPFGATSTKSNAIDVTVEQGYQVSVYTRIGSTNTPTGTTISPTEHIGKTASVTEMSGYAFTGWESNTPNITFEDASALSTLVYATSGGDIYANYTKENCVYFVNTSNWNDVYVYAWNGGGEQKNADCPGVAMTKTGEKIGEFDVYKYCTRYDNLIFSNNGSNQTGDLKWEDGKYYGLEVKISGTFNNWQDSDPFEFSQDGTSASLTLNIDAGSYEFGIKDPNWKKCDNISFSRNSNSHSMTTDCGNEKNAKFTADVTGEYTFTWTFATNTLTITYPQLVIYTVTFNMNGHGTQIAATEVNKNSKITKPKDPTATGYSFDGWYKDANCNTVWNFNTDVVTANTTLYAKWTATEYTITYEGLNDVTHSNPTTYTIESETITFTNPTSERTGYTFTGWNPTQIAKGSTGNQTVTAQWNEILSTITITTNPEEGGRIEVDGQPFTPGNTVQVGATTTKQVRTIPNEGYGVIEWGVSDKNIVIINGGHTVTLKSDGSGRDGTLTARYTPLSRNIQFDKQSGEGGTETATVTYTQNDYSVNPIITPKRAGYTFGGYYSKEKGAGEQVVSAEGAWLANATDYTDANGNWLKSAENTTLYAQWNEIKHTVTISSADENNGTVEPSGKQQIGISGMEVTATPKDPSKFRFAKWEASDGIQVADNYGATTTITATADGEVIAHFEELQPKTIYLKTIGGTTDGVKWYVKYNGTEYLMDELGCTNEYYKGVVPEGTSFQFVSRDASTKIVETKGTDLQYVEGKTLYNLVSAAASGNKIFFKPNSHWKNHKTHKYFVARFWAGSAVIKDLIDNDGDGIYECEKPAGATEVYSCLTKAQASTSNWNDWPSDKEAQTHDNVKEGFKDGKNLFTLGDDQEVGGNNDSGTWSEFADTPVNGEGEWTIFEGATYRITFNHAGATSGTTTPGVAYVDAQYNSSMPTIESLPKNTDWKFAGYYTAANGGTAITNAFGDWLNVDEYISNGKWVKEECVTLYAHWVVKTPEITNVALSKNVFDVGSVETVTATPTVDPHSYTGDIVICWKLLDNSGTVMDLFPFTSGDNNSVSFSVDGLTSGTYIVRASIYASACDTGEELSRFDAKITIVSGYKVTVKYLCGDNVIKVSDIYPGHATTPTPITAPEIGGYKFVNWELGDGIFSESDLNSQTISYTAIYDGYLTAKYEKRKLIFLDISTLPNKEKWTEPHIYLYNSNGYWDDTKGAGATGGACVAKGGMTKVANNENIWYYDYESVNNFGGAVAFTATNKMSQQDFWDCEAIYRTDFSSGTPVFVPASDQEAEIKNNNDGKNASYYNKGYWVKYMDGTGYWLIIYNAEGKKELVRREFTSDTQRMTMTSIVDLEAEHTYQYEIYRNDGYYYNGGDITYTNSSAYRPLNEANKHSIKTTETGDYTFTLDYFTGDLQIKVQYPGEVGDYRILYTDAVRDGRYKPSQIISQNNREPLVSFFVRPNNNPELKVQKATLVTEDEVKWDNEVLYLKPNSNWKADGARFAAAFMNSNKTQTEWVSMTSIKNGDYYGCAIPTGTWKYVIFCRMNPNNHENRWNRDDDGDNKPVWNQTNDLTIPTNGNNQYTVAAGAWSNGSGTWSKHNNDIIDLSEALKEKLGELDLTNIKANEGSVFNIHLSNNDGTPTIEKVALYTGNYYIRVDAVDGKWYDYKTNPDNLMTYSAFSESDENSFGEKFSHYKTKWCVAGTNVKFVIANDYSLCISDTLTQDEGNPFDNIETYGNLSHEANIRFMWNRHTNKVSRAYVAGASGDNTRFLVLKANQTIKNESGQPINNNEVVFKDTQNWLYERTIKVQTGTLVKLIAYYPDGNKAQYFRGTDANGFVKDESAVQILGGTSTEWYTMRIIYDFKTNRLMAAWVPDQNINGTLEIDADIMVIRQHQEDATYITFANNESELTKVKTVYGVMRFNRWTLNNRSTTTHDVLPVQNQKSIYERALYFISFPFDVHLSDVFGFGTYGTHWVISEYNGLRRAKNGYFVDNCMNEDCTNWDYIWDPDDFTMKANQGYLLSLDLDLMKSDNTSFWEHDIQQVELFFPSFAHVQTIEQTSYTMPALSEEDYKCKHKGHEVIDSYWRCIGVPSFADYNSALTTDGTNKITWKPKDTQMPYLYEWNVSDNSLMVRAASTYRFRPTYAYLVQNGNQIHWSAVNATPNQPSNIVARRLAADEVKNYEWKLTLSRNEQIEDQAFVRLSDDEQVTTEFDFNQDLSKEFNYGRSDIYTLIGYEKAAANSLPLSEQTTLIPLGLSIEYNGDYTIAMPGRMENIGVTLIDTESNTRTNLSAGMEYTLTLNKGDYNNRFFIEISPIQQTPTDIEYVTGDSNSQNSVRKVLIDNILYIVRDGQIFDARGARVK